MNIPVSVIAPICIVCFLVCAFQYYRVDPQRRVLNLRFAMMVGALLVLFADVFTPDWSIVWFPLALTLLAFAVYLLRLLPPSRH